MREIPGEQHARQHGEHSRPHGEQAGGERRSTAEQDCRTGRCAPSGRRQTPLAAALEYANRLGWPVLPGAGACADGRCRCAGPRCPVPGLHPDAPELLAATTDPRMVQWWWRSRPVAPLLLATGAPGPCAISLPVPTGRRAVAALDRLGVPAGPVLVSPARLALLVAPYELPELGETLCTLLEAPGGGPRGTARLPAGLRFHGSGGYLPLPPSWAVTGRVEWLRAPAPAPAPAAPPARAERAGSGGAGGGGAGNGGAGDGGAADGLPTAAGVLRALLTAGRLAPGAGSRPRG